VEELETGGVSFWGLGGDVSLILGLEAGLGLEDSLDLEGDFDMVLNFLQSLLKYYS
jgi:hypothetical protein